MDTRPPAVRIEPWTEADLELLRAANTPELMNHLGGPETEEQLLSRHRRYVELSADTTGKGRMFSIVAEADGAAVGTVGYWEQNWHGRTVYETGWTVLPAHQGRGLATAAALAVVRTARAAHRHRYLHAFPSVDNAASNGVCRNAGFSLMGECAFEYPPGHVGRSHDWRLDLRAQEDLPADEAPPSGEDA
ncbi:GNAT family N-acetyltransferase [Streptomyces sp. MUM 178J]|uniref:GNAT family N-acetyltransferase n=1 Tax=Streptomyces sp. MUM 178J TaxID=2791991 RepID=UPI001F042862|nr:GNAT family N-acetyltransferase [Streptomyces sp. MUM 178J]WRQ82034.1 GNAT family N-acetyltransferase [Streptomyces sp. MUM 178J]